MELKGERVVLVPIKREEKEEFYQLATGSYGSRFWYGEDGDDRNREKFFEDWEERYFDESDKDGGQCFWMVVDGKRIGQVNYNRIDKKNKKVELDIIIGPEEYLGKGYGSEALRLLSNHLFENFDINKIWIEARANNPRAIRAYEKVGFKKEGRLREENLFEGKFVDCIRLGMLRSELQ